MKIGVCTLLFLIFLILKLCNVIAWSWWFVTMPLWILPIIIVTVLLVAVLLAPRVR